MKLRIRGLVILMIVIIGLLAACRQAGSVGVTEIVVYITATPGPSVTPSLTATITPTPTPTFTPTATAVPARISGDTRAALIAPPVPQNGARCGIVDLLDFPLDPPNAENASGGRDFGVYRSRYDKYHAGEDWGLSSRSNFGVPVYSIGHGQVTYAEPLGWGADQGVVIIRHILSNGRSILSFYGHLDPPSIDLRVGACVVRGDQVGEIGRPRGRPHLHFEIRTVMPNLPGPGYWPVDPTRAGWLPPSRTVWEQRMMDSPGVIWVGGAETSLSTGLGLLTDDTFAAVSDRKLLGIDPETGTVRWTLEGDEPVEAALLDTSLGVIYSINQLGDLAAFNLPEDPAPASGLLAPEDLDLLWELELEDIGRARLLPIPDGGLVVALPRALIGVSASGKVGWRQEIARPIQGWSHWGERLVFTFGGGDRGLWAAGESSPYLLAAGLSGLPVSSSRNGYLYDLEGIYLWEGDAAQPEKLLALPQAFPALGDLIVLPGGDLLLAHMDRADRRLIALGLDGNLRWERSVAALPAGDLRLTLIQDAAYLLVDDSTSPSHQIYVYAIGLADGELFHLFTGGTRAALAGEVWFYASETGQLIIHLGGGSLVALDPAMARAALSPE
jgi:murein DD-endopeptidase MepM/ murein hydrolase activator NlpD